jgi:hypothetical protein
MIAYNLGLGFARRIDVAASERWFRTSSDLARHLLFVLRRGRRGGPNRPPVHQNRAPSGEW